MVALETVGGDSFFGEPAIDIADFFRTDAEGRGMINIMDAEETIQSPLIYSTFMLYMMSELFEQLPEVGDPEKPKMVFFFDEAHLLFKGAPKALLEKIEQVVKLIRSKGVGVFFITQNPSHVPDAVLAQHGNKLQHALRAYTPAEEKKLKSAAASYRKNPAFDPKKVLEELGTGEALVSFLDRKGSPEMVRRCKVLPPASRMGSITDADRALAIKRSPLAGRYDEMVDRDSAYEFLKRKSDEAAQAYANQKAEEEAAKAAEKEALAKAKEEEKKKKQLQTAGKNVGKSLTGSVGRQVGQAVGGTLFGKVGKTVGGNVGASLGRGILDTLFGR